MLSVMTALGARGVGSRWAGDRCLQMLAHQPGPMGGEVCELIKQRDPESPLLRCRHTLSTPFSTWKEKESISWDGIDKLAFLVDQKVPAACQHLTIQLCVSVGQVAQ